MASQGYFQFPGVDSVLNASMTLSLGINPSAIRITVPPLNESPLGKTGDAVWSYKAVDQYSDDDMSRTFSDCLVDSVEAIRQGNSTWQIILLDRRWKWKFGQISGRYNVRVNGTVLPRKRKSVRELASLCLDAMGETGYDVSIIPDNDYPNVNWDLEVPAKAMAEIVEEYGITFSLQRDNTIKAVRLGFGGAIPGKNQLTFNSTFDPSNFPSAIRSVSRPTLFQADLELEAVGYEEEVGIRGPASTVCTELKLLEDLSYKPYTFKDNVPYANWTSHDPKNLGGYSFKSLGVPDGDYRARNKRREVITSYPYKYYRIKLDTLSSQSNIRLPIDFEITDIDQILPLTDYNVGREGCEEDLRPKPAMVYGIIENNRAIDLRSPTGTVATRPGYDINGNLTTVQSDIEEWIKLDDLEPRHFRPFDDSAFTYSGGFSIEGELGLVKFSQPVYAIQQGSEPGAVDKQSDDPTAPIKKDFTTGLDSFVWETTFNPDNSVSYSSLRYVPAKIWLRCGIRVRDPQGTFHRRYREVVLDPSLDTDPEFLPREDVFMQFMRFSDDYQPVEKDENGDIVEDSILDSEELAKAWDSNEAEVDKELDLYNSQAIYNYQSYPGAEADFAGFVDIDTDGAIRQISYSIRSGVATSKAVRNTERRENTLTLLESRRRQKITSILDQEKKRQKSADDGKRAKGDRVE